jgi:hypothetical protein
MNHSFSMDMAHAFAERIVREAGDTVADQVSRAFALAYSRPPSGEEVSASAALIEAHGLRAFCRAVLNSNEFVSLE